MFGGARLESGEVGGPDGQGGVLEGTRGHGRGVADAETGRLFILLLEILLCQGIELCAILLLDNAAFAVKTLDVVEPGNAIADPDICGFEAILSLGGKGDGTGLVRSDVKTRLFVGLQEKQWNEKRERKEGKKRKQVFFFSLTYLQFGAEGRGNVDLGHIHAAGSCLLTRSLVHLDKTLSAQQEEKEIVSSRRQTTPEPV